MTLSNPAAVMARLEEIERDLATRQNALESAAQDWFMSKREREKTEAVRFIEKAGTVAERRAYAVRDSVEVGREAEAAYEAQKAVVRVLETRANIGMSLLRAQSQGRS